MFPSARQASSIRERSAGPEIASIRSDGSIPAADSGRIATPQAPGGQLRQHQRVGRLEGDVRLHPDAGAALLQRGSHSRAARHADQRFLDQRPQRHFPAPGQAVSGGHGRHQPIIDDQLTFDVGGRRSGHADQGEVQRAVAEATQELGGLVLVEADLDAGVRGVKAGQQIGALARRLARRHP
jgi:hypothetical protein